MHDILLEYNKTDLPRCKDIEKFTIGTTQEYDTSWIEDQGEIIMRIPCADGLIVIIRKGYWTEGTEASSRCSGSYEKECHK